ncbi:hypothetical protein [Streptomyces sp. NPDC058108]|uniref:hypothetical protein n=1 Tax=Streptomyces sp. NPDC058108 TaxID=3346344 RepID=UPI0036EC4917
MSAPTLLVFDYPGRRPEARVSDLRLVDAGYDVHQLMAPPLPRAASAANYAQQALDTVAGSFGEVHAVLGYCMAAPLAQEAAVRAGCPRVLLFDGEPSTPHAVEVEYRKLLTSVGAPATLPSWWDTALLREHSERFLGLAEQHLTETIRRSLEEGAEPDEYDDEDGDDALAPLVGGFLDWLAYLVAAYRTEHPAWDGSVINFLSRQQPEIVAWPGARSTRSVRVDTARDDLLSDAATRRQVMETLREPAREHANPEEGAQ